VRAMGPPPRSRGASVGTVTFQNFKLGSWEKGYSKKRAGAEGGDESPCPSLIPVGLSHCP
jgi:hypothetical protein